MSEGLTKTQARNIFYGGSIFFLVVFVGLTIAQKTQVSSQPLDTTQFLDEVTTAQSMINLLESRGYDKIGLVTHYGYTNDLEGMRRKLDLDLRYLEQRSIALDLRLILKTFPRFWDRSAC